MIAAFFTSSPQGLLDGFVEARARFQFSRVQCCSSVIAQALRLSLYGELAGLNNAQVQAHVILAHGGQLICSISGSANELRGFVVDTLFRHFSSNSYEMNCPAVTLFVLLPRNVLSLPLC